jgi:pantoate--beta-alanine ligase
VTPEYLCGVDPTTLVPVEVLQRETLFVTAAPVGPVRLIDNVIVTI